MRERAEICLIVVLLMCSLLIGCAGAGAANKPTPTVALPTPTATSEPAKPQLELLSAVSSSTKYGSRYMTVEGQVKNISQDRIEHPMAVVEWYTSSGQFITSDRALTTYRPLLPGQTTPFEVITPTNPAMAKYSVTFTDLNGRNIPAIGTGK